MEKSSERRTFKGHQKMSFDELDKKGRSRNLLFIRKPP
jgi:hypothetical protein